MYYSIYSFIFRQLNEENQNKLTALQDSFAEKMDDCSRERDENIGMHIELDARTL